LEGVGAIRGASIKGFIVQLESDTRDVLIFADDLLAEFPARAPAPDPVIANAIRLYLPPAKSPAPKPRAAKRSGKPRAARKPSLLDKTVEVLPRLFPTGRGERDTHDEIRARLKDENLTVSDTTLKRAFRALGWASS
jgi:hypothetical protein